MSEAIKGGRLMAEQLVASGVTTIFALAGAGHTHLLMELEDLGVRLIGTRHETGAVGAADGYARTTGKPGIAAIIAEQGLPNAITAIETAFLYGSPVVVLVTRFPQNWLEVGGEIAIDHHARLAGITKWARTVPSPDKLGDYLATGLRIAQSGRPGPVVLVIPQDFLALPVPSSAARGAPALPCPAAPSPEAMAELLKLIPTAERPAILVDAGLDGVRAGDALGSLNAAGMAIFGYGGARGAIAENDGLGVLPWPYAQFALPACDLLIVAGARLNMWFGFGRAPRFPATTKVVQIDAVAEAIGRNQPVDLGIVADPAIALAHLADALAETAHAGWRRDWFDEALAPRRAAITATRSDAIHALALVAALQERRPKQGYLIVDGADILNWSHAAFRVARPRGYIDHHPMGSMGMGLPLAIGAAAEQEQAQAEGREPCPALLLTGDGALGFYLAELDSVARAGLPLKIAIGNDAQWGTEYHGQQLMTGRNVNTRLAEVDYGAVARGLGLAAATINEPQNLAAAIDRLFVDSLPALLDVRIDREAGRSLKTDPRLSFLIFSDLAPPDR